MVGTFSEMKQRLVKEFPGRKIFEADDHNELVVELQRDDHQSVAVAFVRRSKPHRHERTGEFYLVEEGCANVIIDGVVYKLIPGKGCMILPGQIHSVSCISTEPEGDECGHLQAWSEVRVWASPPWTPDDHILV